VCLLRACGGVRSCAACAWALGPYDQALLILPFLFFASQTSSDVRSTYTTTKRTNTECLALNQGRAGAQPRPTESSACACEGHATDE
jgi:hypothetical protein